MAKVYVTVESNLDFRDAEQYGEIVFLTDRRDDFVNVAQSAHNTRLMAHLRHALRAFSPLQDWLVITGGGPYVSAMVFALLGSLGVRRFRLLRWDNRDFRYIPLEIDIGDRL